MYVFEILEILNQALFDFLFFRNMKVTLLRYILHPTLS